jgi:hypothetical protein
MAIDSIQSDIEALAHARAEGRPIDPEIAKRVHERAEQVRADAVRLHGVQNIGVDIIRQARDSVRDL